MRSTARSSTARAASRIALAIPSGPELPCPTTASPRRPSRIAPPVVSGSIWLRSEPSAGRNSSPPAAARGPERAAARTASATARAVPSIVFSTTLPVKPSVTTTSAPPLIRSRPSTLPTKSMPAACPPLAASRCSPPRPPRSPCSAPRRPREAPPAASRRRGPPAEGRAQVGELDQVAPPAPRRSRRRPGTGWAARSGPGRELHRERRTANALHAAEREQRRRHRGPRRPGAHQRFRAPLRDVAGGHHDRGLGRERTAATGSSEFVISSAAATSSTPSISSPARQRLGVAEDAQPDSIGRRRAGAGDDHLRPPLGATAVEGHGVTGHRGRYLLRLGCPVSRGADSAISCLITSRPA